MQQVEIKFLHYLGTLSFLHHLKVVILHCLTAPSGSEYNTADMAISRARYTATIYNVSGFCLCAVSSEIVILMLYLQMVQKTRLFKQKQWIIHIRNRESKQTKVNGYFLFCWERRGYTVCSAVIFREFRITFASCGELSGALLAVADHLKDHWLDTIQPPLLDVSTRKEL